MGSEENKKKKKRKRRASTSSSDDSSSSCSQRKKAKRHKKKEEKKLRKILRKLERKKKKKDKKDKKHNQTETPESSTKIAKKTATNKSDEDVNEQSLAMRPMTPAEYEARRSVIRRVYDEETGRTRLIKGDGEILEEVVTRERHLAINKQATRGDGQSFQSNLGLLK